jgi:hypothetical protein
LNLEPLIDLEGRRPTIYPFLNIRAPRVAITCSGHAARLLPGPIQALVYILIVACSRLKRNPGGHEVSGEAERIE